MENAIEYGFRRTSVALYFRFMTTT